MGLNLKKLLDNKYMDDVARNATELTEEEITILYIGGYFGIFSNMNLKIPTHVILDYVKKKIPYDDFFIREDVKEVMEQVIDVYIEEYASIWMKDYLRRYGGAGVTYFGESAWSHMMKNLERLFNKGVVLTAQNVEHLLKYKDVISFFKDGRESLHRVMKKCEN